MPTLTFPLSRIEGHARVVIEVWGGEVQAAYFQATEIRGFQLLVQGTPAEQMPVITPRICGVCSTAHHIASVKALEDAYGVTPPPLARTLRRLLLLGQLIQNQATSLFLFTMPDRLGATSLFEAAKEDGPEGTVARIAQGALRVRKVGTDLITLAGGQFIHPIKAVVGGVTSGIGAEEAAAMRTELADMLPVTRQLVEYYAETSAALAERLDTWGDDEPAYYVATGDGQKLNLDGDAIQVMGPDGSMRQSFAARDFRQHLIYQDSAYSYAGQTSYEGEVMRANSLARVNIVDSLGTPVADEYLARFRETFGRPAHAILFFDLARCIELVYAMEQAMKILAEPLNQEDADLPYRPRDGEGYGLVEAPRGPLIHHYRIEKGLVAEAEFVIPTVHNTLAIERALHVAAQRYISAERVDMELERAVGRVVRAFDPCIACATH
jgi:F420-non-reducing hydrogenase large subunit